MCWTFKQTEHKYNPQDNTSDAISGHDFQGRGEAVYGLDLGLKSTPQKLGHRTRGHTP